MSQCLSGVCLGLYVSMSQMSQCLRALPPLCSVSGPSVSQPPMSQGGSAWASVAMSQCLNVSGGSAWASTERLNVSMSQLFRRGLPGPARSVSTSQCLSCLGGVCLGQLGALNVSMSQLSQGGFAWASTARLNVSMSQCLREVCLGETRTSAAASQCLSASGRSAWGRPGPAQPRLNVSVPQGGLPEGDQDQRSRVSQCLRCLPVSGSLSPLSRRRASASIQSVGEHPERRRAASRTSASIQRRRASRASASLQSIGKHQRASTASASIKVGFGLGCGKATQKKTRPALPKPGTQPAKLPLEHTARAGRMQGSLVGLGFYGFGRVGSGRRTDKTHRALPGQPRKDEGDKGSGARVRDLGTTSVEKHSVAPAPAREPDFRLSDWPNLIRAFAGV